MNTSIIDSCIPLKCRQASYDKSHGCDWLSACVLIHSVDTKVVKNVIERYANDQETFKWLDIFRRQNRISKQKTTLIQSNLWD